MIQTGLDELKFIKRIHLLTKIKNKITSNEQC